MHSSTIRSAIVCAAVILVVIGGSQPAAAGSRWHPRKPHSHTRGPHSHPQQPQTYELAVFEWHQLSRLDDEVTPRLRWLRAEGFTTVYADFGEYIEAAEAANQLPFDERSIRRLAQLGRDLRRFVAYASSLGFEVHAVSGGPNWINDLDYLAPLMVELVAAYNKAATREERLRGVQLDIEPHADPTFDDDISKQPDILRAYLTALNKVVDAYRKARHQRANRGLRLGFAIPFWFDDDAGAAPEVEFPKTEDSSGIIQPATFHLFDMLRDLPDAYVIVLSYRNFTGELYELEGSIALTEREFEHAQEIHAQFGIVVGQEFTNVDPWYITFWCVGRAAFRQAAREITDAFDQYPQFRGLSVNDMDAYLATPGYVVSSRSRIMGGWRTSPRCPGVGAGSPFVTGT